MSSIFESYSVARHSFSNQVANAAGQAEGAMTPLREGHLQHTDATGRVRVTMPAACLVSRSNRFHLRRALLGARSFVIHLAGATWGTRPSIPGGLSPGGQDERKLLCIASPPLYADASVD